MVVDLDLVEILRNLGGSLDINLDNTYFVFVIDDYYVSFWNYGGNSINHGKGISVSDWVIKGIIE